MTPEQFADLKSFLSAEFALLRASIAEAQKSQTAPAAPQADPVTKAHQATGNRLLTQLGYIPPVTEER